MADKTTKSIVVDATPDEVMAVIADFPKYPEWVTAVKSVEVLESASDDRARRVKFVLDAGMVKDTYELQYEWKADGSAVSWHLVAGEVQKSQVGSYALSDKGNGVTEVVYELTVDLAIPMIGLFKRKAEKVITDTALKELKKRVEA